MHSVCHTQLLWIVFKLALFVLLRVARLLFIEADVAT